MPQPTPECLRCQECNSLCAKPPGAHLRSAPTKPGWARAGRTFRKLSRREFLTAAQAILGIGAAVIALAPPAWQPRSSRGDRREECEEGRDAGPAGWAPERRMDPRVPAPPVGGGDFGRQAE
ncbi:twin-arginine translocation signal domain-containing protein [Streptomyces cellostaticus]|uniref:twin-arginine translocation signal domain-containing protein n=1 Tax=Streptomyces cellostaticus TaxID=67285 RepID=UPI0035A954C3